MNPSTNRNQKKNRLRLLYSLLAVGVTAIVVCVCGLSRELYTRRQGQSYYASMYTDAVSAATESRPAAAAEGLTPVVTPAPAPGEESEGASEEESEGEPEEPVNARQQPNYDGNPNETPVKAQQQQSFEAMREANPDLVAWIRCEGTVINYPVVQGSDNEHYLNYLPNGKKNKMGSIFLDYHNSSDFSDKNSLIYGHNMKSGDMFGVLKRYQEQAFYDKHPTMTLRTPEKNYEVALFAGYVLDSAAETPPPFKFRDASAFELFIDDIKQRSTFKCAVDVSAEDRLVTLCTCTGTSSDIRYILVGKLTEMAK